MFKIGDIVELPKYHKGKHWIVKKKRGYVLYVSPIKDYGSFSHNSQYSTNEADCTMIQSKQSNIPWL